MTTSTIAEKQNPAMIAACDSGRMVWALILTVLWAAAHLRADGIERLSEVGELLILRAGGGGEVARVEAASETGLAGGCDSHHAAAFGRSAPRRRRPTAEPWQQ